MLDKALRPQFDIVPWNTSFETGIAIIDEQHRRLVELINDLAHETVYGGEAGVAQRIVEALIDYAAYHFATEEALWAEVLVNDDTLDGHLHTHNGFVTKVLEMQARLNIDNDRILIDDLLSFLTGWLAHHILYEDKRFSLVYLQVHEGADLATAKQYAHDAMTGKTSGLIQSVLSMYKELSSRTLALEREAYSRRKAEQALLDQEQHWNAVLGASSDNLWDWSLAAEEAIWDEQLLTKERFTQQGFTIHPDDWPCVRQEFINHMLGRSDVFQRQYRVIDVAGNQRWIMSRGKVIEQDDVGHPMRIVGTQTDITERKTMELTLQRERDMRTLISEFAADFMASTSQDFDAAINRALQRSGEYMQAERTYVFLLTSDGRRLNNTHEWCAAGIEPEIENLQGVPSSALPWWWSQFQDVGYVLVPRVSDMPPEAKNEYQILESQGIQSVCVYPLHVGKQLVGFMGCDSVTEERYWGAEVIKFLSLMSDLFGISLEHRQLLLKRELAIEQLERAEALAQLGHWRIDYATKEVLWSQQIFRLFERDANSYRPNLESYLELVHPDDRVALYRSYESAADTLSQLHLEHRLLLNEGKVKHVEIRGRFERTAEGRLVVAEGTVQDVTEKVQHRDSLHRLAYHDSLTGLPNRRAIEKTLLDEMDYCQRQERSLVVALLDLDNFREINDQHGAVVGDALLRTLAQRIRRAFVDTAMIARVGGDEFVVLFSQLQPDDNYFQQLNRLLTVINQPITVEGVSIVLQASMGVTKYPQPNEQAAEQLLRQAQQALFQAKMQGKGCFHEYDIGSEQDARVRTDCLEQISNALRTDELRLYYQPKVNMRSGEMIGVEALVRWRKDNEWIMPGEFLPALHNHPLEIELGDWVMRTALAQMREWKQQGLSIQVSVNVSSQQLFDEAFVDKLGKALEGYPDIAPSALQLEVLESSMLHDLETVSVVMHRSRQLGVSFALDDFGTGYSSLAHLKHLPARVLKIDQSFVREMMQSSDDLSIISGVIGMAKAFGMQIVAEGVETIEQGCLLLKLGCELAQGYAVARPLQADMLSDWIQHWRAVPAWTGQQPVGVHNLPLLYAEVEHRSWVAELERWLYGEGESIPTLDHHLCRVGIWMDSDAQNRFGHSPQFSHLEYMHRELHRLGKAVVSLHARGEVESALLLLPQIRDRHEQFLSELMTLLD
ncbi:MAG: bacteriohemerythrin [Thiopseudomonas sp.]|nr:bacteriohemerythrin [Thiopseudomonas sp.]MCK9466533.1 bacteriohemerythrin [Thiopseudomonas sp.]